MCVDELGVDEMGVDEMGSRRSGMTPNMYLHELTSYAKGISEQTIKSAYG